MTVSFYNVTSISAIVTADSDDVFGLPQTLGDMGTPADDLQSAQSTPTNSNEVQTRKTNDILETLGSPQKSPSRGE